MQKEREDKTLLQLVPGETRKKAVHALCILHHSFVFKSSCLYGDYKFIISVFQRDTAQSLAGRRFIFFKLCARLPDGSLLCHGIYSWVFAETDHQRSLGLGFSAGRCGQAHKASLICQLQDKNQSKCWMF